MNELINSFWQTGAATINIQLWHIWIFVLVVSGMVFVKCKRAIAVLSLFTAIVLGWQDSMAAVKESVSAPSVLWLTYLSIGLFIFFSFLCSVTMDD
jgi:hypothetical protein